MSCSWICNMLAAFIVTGSATLALLLPAMLLVSSPIPRRSAKAGADATIRPTAWHKAPATGSHRR